MDDLLLDGFGQPERSPATKARRRRLAASSAVLTMAAVGAVGLTTGALFTDNDAANANEFTSGTVDVATTPASSVVSNGNMAPGDVSYGALTVKNSGTLAYRYAVSESATNSDGKNLASQLRMTLYSVPDNDSCSAEGVTDAPQIGSHDGLSLTEVTMVGNRTVGADPGDRTLHSGENETLCVRLALPLDTGNAYQGATSDVSLTFYAEQTAHNS